jgi:hypothetical protein
MTRPLTRVISVRTSEFDCVTSASTNMRRGRAVEGRADVADVVIVGIVMLVRHVVQMAEMRI